MRSLVTALILLISALVRSQTIEIGEVDLFGQTGLDEQKVRAALTIHAGDKIAAEQWPDATLKLNEAIQKVLGKPPTDVALVSFDKHGKTMVFVGLPGPTIKTVRPRSAPTGTAKLPDDASNLYKTFIERLPKALAEGNLKEDDSKGYALVSDPEMHAAQLKMRDYALANEGIIRLVLKTSASADQRQAAAMLLGYANRSKAQIDDLAAAATDADNGVRNNAVRALVVISHGDPASMRLFPVEVFVDMVRSGTWTDRNKGGWMVEALTQGRDPKVLNLVKKSALPSLIEIAHWTNPPHASSAWLILGRIGGIEEKRLQEMVAKEDVRGILATVGQ